METEQMYKDKASRIMYMTHLSRYHFIKTLCKNKFILDMGCGTGYGAYFLRNIARGIVAIDLDKNAINYALRNYSKNESKVKYRIFDVSSRQFNDFMKKENLIPENKFDIVISFEVIEHLENQNQYLKNARSQLRKNGTFICSTPQIGSVRHSHWHKKELTYKEFRELLNKYFKNVKIFSQKRKFMPRNKIVNFLYERIVTPNSYTFVDFSQYKECKYMVAICSDKDIDLSKLA